MRVGTKELKNRLSHYVRAVRAGEVVQITDRGAVVAEIRAVRPSRSDNAALRTLAKEGTVTLGTGRAADHVPTRLRKRVRPSDWIIEDRR